jgi:formamidase
MIFCCPQKSGFLGLSRDGILFKERHMNGLGGLNKSPNGVVIGLVQLQLPVVVTKADLARQTERIVYMVGKARRNLGTMDLVVFPEYSLHGLSMDTNPAIMCRLDGPEVAAFKKACIDNKIWGCFSIMEFNPDGNPYNSGLIIDDQGSTTGNSTRGFRSSRGSPATSASP